MIIRFFKSNNAAGLFILPLIAIATWTFGFVTPDDVPVKHAMPLFELTGAPLAAISWLATLTAMVLVLAGAYSINYIVNENEVLTKKTNLPALFYVVFMSNNISMLELHPLLFSNLFLLFAINKLLSSYRKDLAFSQVFDAGLLVSTASLFYFPSVVFLPLIGIGLILFRPFNWREWVISFIGVIVPYIFAVTYYFWNDTLDYLFYDKMFFPIIFKAPVTGLSQSFYFLLTVGWIIVLFSFGRLFSGLGGGSQKTKKSLVLMLWMFVFSGLSVFLAPEISTKYFSAMAIPVTVICSNYFIRQKKELWGEILFLIFLAAIFVDLLSSIF